MAMITNFIHDGKSGLPHDAFNKPVGWDFWHVARLHDAMAIETGNPDCPFYVDEYTFTQDHVFVELETNIWSRGGEPDTEYKFTIVKGDMYKCHRS